MLKYYLCKILSRTLFNMSAMVVVFLDGPELCFLGLAGIPSSDISTLRPPSAVIVCCLPKAFLLRSAAAATPESSKLSSVPNNCFATTFFNFALLQNIYKLFLLQNFEIISRLKKCKSNKNICMSAKTTLKVRACPVDRN